jgi:hypothetical protein
MIARACAVDELRRPDQEFVAETLFNSFTSPPSPRMASSEISQEIDKYGS